jgi:hypothetical protein
VDDVGNLLIADLGTRHIRRFLASAGYPTLTLDNVTAGNAGYYSVVVTNSWGSVTSAAASLTVLAPPIVSSISAGPASTITLSFLGEAGASYRVWTTPNLAPPVAWAPVSTNIAGPDGTWQITFTNITVWPGLFYRASMP